MFKSVMPSNLRIGPYNYTIKIDANKISDVYTHGGVRCLGFTDRNRCEIFLDPELAPHMRAHILFHEVLHGVWGISGLNTHEVLTENEEGIVDCFAVGIMQVLRDNPELVKYLVKGE